MSRREERWAGWCAGKQEGRDRGGGWCAVVSRAIAPNILRLDCPAKQHWTSSLLCMVELALSGMLHFSAYILHTNMAAISHSIADRTTCTNMAAAVNTAQAGIPNNLKSPTVGLNYNSPPRGQWRCDTCGPTHIPVAPTPPY